MKFMTKYTARLIAKAIILASKTTRLSLSDHQGVTSGFNATAYQQIDVSVGTHSHMFFVAMWEITVRIKVGNQVLFVSSVCNKWLHPFFLEMYDALESHLVPDPYEKYDYDDFDEHNDAHEEQFLL